MPSLLTLPYYAARRAVSSGAARLADFCDAQTRRCYAWPPESLSHRARQALQQGASLALAASSSPRLDRTLILGPQWSAVYVGDHAFIDEAARVFAPGDTGRTPLERVPVWPLADATEADLARADIVVIGLPRAFPHPRVHGRAGVRRLPMYVVQWLTLDRPLTQLLAGPDRSGIRQRVERARAAGFSARFTHSREDLERFHQQMYVPLASGQHGRYATITPEDGQWRRLQERGVELMMLEVRGGAVAGGLLQHLGHCTFVGEIGLDASALTSRERSAGPTAVFLLALDRAYEMGSRHFSLGASLARCSDPVYRAKRRWGAVPRPREASKLPWWTICVRGDNAALLDHLNRQGLITFDRDERPAVVRFDGSPSRCEFSLEGLDQELVVAPDRHEWRHLEARPSGSA